MNGQKTLDIGKFVRGISRRDTNTLNRYPERLMEKIRAGMKPNGINGTGWYLAKWKAVSEEIKERKNAPALEKEPSRKRFLPSLPIPD